MANIGANSLTIAKCVEFRGSIEYSSQLHYKRIVNIDISPKYEDISEYADMNELEQKEELQYVDLTVEVCEITKEAETVMLGHSINEEDEIVETFWDEPQTVGIGFVCRDQINGKSYYTGFWIKKAKLHQSGDSHETIKDGFKYTTTELKGRAYPCSDGSWRKKKIFETKNQAQDWLDQTAGIKKEGA